MFDLHKNKVLFIREHCAQSEGQFKLPVLDAKK